MRDATCHYTEARVKVICKSVAEGSMCGAGGLAKGSARKFVFSVIS